MPGQLFSDDARGPSARAAGATALTARTTAAAVSNAFISTPNQVSCCCTATARPEIGVSIFRGQDPRCHRFVAVECRKIRIIQPVKPRSAAGRRSAPHLCGAEKKPAFTPPSARLAARRSSTSATVWSTTALRMPSCARDHCTSRSMRSMFGAPAIERPRRRRRPHQVRWPRRRISRTAPGRRRGAQLHAQPAHPVVDRARRLDDRGAPRP